MSLPLLLEKPRSAQPLLVLQSTPAQSIFPLLSALCNRPTVHTILYTFLYSPSTLVDQTSSNIETHDWTAQVPGYCDLRDVKTELLAAIKSVSKEMPLAVVVDSLETLSENLACSGNVYELLVEVLDIIKAHSPPSQFVLHTLKTDNTLDILLQTSFSSSLVHLMAHPTSLFRFLSKEYMISPPPTTPNVKFWRTFIPFSERTHEAERLSFGPDGEGTGCAHEMVIEILVRGINAQSRKRGIERVLEGWDWIKNSPCVIPDLQDLRMLFMQKQAAEAAPDPTQNLSFNLNLSNSQQQSRAQVPLPYAHEGQHINTLPIHSGTIFYDPDSADDIDGDDPDEDLDI